MDITLKNYANDCYDQLLSVDRYSGGEWFWYRFCIHDQLQWKEAINEQTFSRLNAFPD